MSTGKGDVFTLLCTFKDQTMINIAALLGSKGDHGYDDKISVINRAV
jgi:hypothetical protein